MKAEVEQDAGSGEDDNDAEWYRKEVGHDPETATKTCEGESRPFERREPRNNTLGRCIHQTAECSKRIQDGRYLQSFKELEEQGHTPRKKNAIKDFVSIAGVLHVSHLCIFSSTELGTYMKVARLPHGPTLTFQVHNYSLTRDVVSATKKQFVFEKLYQNAPLIVLNSFSGEGLHIEANGLHVSEHVSNHQHYKGEAEKHPSLCTPELRRQYEDD